MVPVTLYSMALNGRMITVWIRNDLDGSSHGFIYCSSICVKGLETKLWRILRKD